MIQIIGAENLEDKPEYQAALHLCDLLVAAWSEKVAHESQVLIFPNIQCYGESPQDIDLVVLGFFHDGISFHRSIPLYAFSPDSHQEPRLVSDSTIGLASICCTIEVKDQSQENVNFEGNKVFVRYKEGWHAASQQSEDQKYSLKNYVNKNLKQELTVPYITNLIWMRNIDRESIPNIGNNILPGQFTLGYFLNKLASLSRLHKADGKWALSCSKEFSRREITLMQDLLSRRLEPSQIDRNKMDRLCKHKANEVLTNSLGKKLLILHGRGGTGKTLIMLQLAYHAYMKSRYRSIILTYNKALVADIKRIMKLAGISEDIAQATIEVKTIHSFIYRIARALGLVSENVDYLEQYDEIKQQLNEYLSQGLLDKDEKEKLIYSAPNELDWDLVFIDEAQDMPEDEKLLLTGIYGINKFTISDGVDQLIRSTRPCNWRHRLTDEQLHLEQLEVSLRMKKNLAAFVNAFARKIGLKKWKVSQNSEAMGGRIIIVEGDYFSKPERHQKIMQSALELGNSHVDMLCCVTPSYAMANDESESPICQKFKDIRQEIWDGTNVIQRGAYPTSLNQLRVIKYESCRGLEGWVALNISLDEFYEYKINSFREQMGEIGRETSLDEIEMFAKQWLMIPLTRAMDTLVINVSKEDSYMKVVLKSLYEQECKDIIEWMT